MSAFRLFSKLNTLYGLTGQLLAGGQLKFYDAGTTTARNVYGNLALSVNNGSTVTLDSSGRPSVDVWGTGSYFVEAYSSAGVKQGEADNVLIPGGTGAAVIPALQSGKYLTNNGSVYLWSTIREMPDPTGQDGKVPVASGGGYLLQSPTSVTPGVVARQTIAAAATTNIDLALGLAVNLTQDVNVTTLTFTNVPTGAFVLSIRRVKDATTTARTITWPSSVKWPAATAPTLTQTSGAIDELALKYDSSIYTGSYQLAFG